jgi:hypothetical protein
MIDNAPPMSSGSSIFSCVQVSVAKDKRRKRWGKEMGNKRKRRDGEDGEGKKMWLKLCTHNSAGVWARSIVFTCKYRTPTCIKIIMGMDV